MSEIRELPATAVQRQFWLLQQLSPHSVAYHVPALFHVRGPLQVSALAQAAARVVQRHAALRTTFAERDGQLLACTHARLEPVFVVEQHAIDRDSPELTEEFQRPFDLARGPLFRMRVWPAAQGGHLLAWTMHHSICDLDSKNRIAAELSAEYASAHMPTSAHASTAPPTDFASYCLHEHALLESAAAQRAEDYFALHLGPVTQLAKLALPEDHPRPKLHTQRGVALHFALPPAIVSKLHARCAELPTKPFLLLLGAYAALLGRYGQHARVVLGVPFSNRRHPSSQGVVGPFVNNLPLAVDLPDEQTFADLCRALRANMLGHHRHQELPLERIVKRTRVMREPGANALFQAGFTFEPPPTLDLAQLQVESIDVHAGGSQLDLFMTLWPIGDGFSGRLEYCTDLFERASMQQLLRSYFALLEHALSADAFSHTPLAALRILDPADRQQVLHTWNNTQRSYPPPLYVHETFLRQAERNPQAIALRLGAREVSYGELRARAQGLAHELRALGVQPGDCVGLFMERSLEMLVGIYGTLLAGAAYVPLDPEFPEARLSFMLEDSAPRCVLSHAPVAERWPFAQTQPQLACRVISFDALPEAAVGPQLALRDDSPAYVLFTSGSTGRPKGVINTHRGIGNRIAWMQEAYALQQSDVVLQKTPYSFDVSTWEFFWPLGVGARLEIAEPGVHRDPGALAALIERTGVTTLHFVPSMLEAFVAHPAAARCTCLQRIVCSGEALGTALVRRTTELLPAAVYNLYGPTEAAVDVTAWACRDDVSRDPVPIGKPIANTQLYVLDAKLQPVPVGVLGELYIGGVQVALGYINRAELTAERFVPDPFTSEPAGRLYRTGDLGRWQADGNIAYAGRIDHQVKVRGQRIELGEIESVLAQHPSVQQSVVVARRIGSSDTQLIAYVQADAAHNHAELVASLRARMHATLPTAMHCQQIVVLQSLPLTASGKVDRKALPEPEQKPSSANSAEQAPRDAIEHWLSATFCELLQVPSVATHENLFELGASSLMCAQLVGRIHRQFDMDVPLVRVFEHPTIAALGQHLGDLERARTASATEGAADDQQSDTSLDTARERAIRQRAAAMRPAPRRSH